jgi:uncharacterized protein (TIGR03118 family)
VQHPQHCDGLSGLTKYKRQEKKKMNAVMRLLKSCGISVIALCSLPAITFAQHYTQTNLASDGFISTPVVDPNLSNPWGLTRSATGSPWWVANNNTGTSTLYSYINETVSSTGTVLTPPSVEPVKIGPAGFVTIPLPPNAPSGDTASAPTGVVQNGSSDFVVTNSATGASGPAAFIFCTEDGTISGWNPTANIAEAVLTVNNSPQAVYKGCTSGDIDGIRFLYVANFRSGRIEVYDTNFHRVFFSEETFDDDQIPRDFAPFNVQNVGGSLIVTYAKQDAAKHDPVGGEGFGYVDIFTTSGRLERRLQHGVWLNAPWGVVWAPRDFGEFSNRLLIGNFRGGLIAAYDGFSGEFIGLMENPDGSNVNIDGLWSLTFGNSAAGCQPAPPTGSNLPKCGSAGPYNTLFFTAGPDGETHGLFGILTPVAGEQDGDEE